MTSDALSAGIATKLAEAFCATRLPDGVCADLCASMRDYGEPRYGTHLLTVAQAEKMMRQILQDVPLVSSPAGSASAREEALFLAQNALEHIAGCDDETRIADKEKLSFVLGTAWKALTDIKAALAQPQDDNT